MRLDIIFSNRDFLVNHRRARHTGFLREGRSAAVADCREQFFLESLVNLAAGYVTVKFFAVCEYAESVDSSFYVFDRDFTGRHVDIIFTIEPHHIVVCVNKPQAARLDDISFLRCAGLCGARCAETDVQVALALAVNGFVFGRGVLCAGNGRQCEKCRSQSLEYDFSAHFSKV